MPDRPSNWNNAISDDGPTDEQTVRRLYDEFASEYNRTVVDWGYDAPEQAAQYLGQYVARTAPVLDAGCGTGLTGQALNAAGFTHITGTDLSADSIAIAKGTPFYRAVLALNLSEPLPFQDQQFAGAVSIGVFTYIDDLEPVLSELIRVTSPGGIIVFTQRQDLYVERDQHALFSALRAEHGIEQIESTEPRPYLPGNPSFAEKIGIHYFVWRVSESVAKE
ncbi:MAG: methyltransferase domain-containing protein [Pseudomonadota bacterium]